MIELDYQDTLSIESFAEASGYFSNSITELRKTYNANRPKVLGIEEFENGLSGIDPNTKEITLRFSRPMSDRFMNHKFGPLGSDHLLPIEDVTWSKDKTFLTYTVSLEPNKRYQIVVDDEFRAIDGAVIERYLIDFRKAND